jgi:hypothetical protein
MTIKIPAGMEPSPEDVERGTIEEIAVFSINAEEGTLTLKSVGDFQITEEGENEETTDEGTSTVPSEDETLEEFMGGFAAQQGM